MNFENYKGKKVLVTGGAGFFAHHLTKRLVSYGADVYVLVKYKSIIDCVRLVSVWDKIKIVEADLRNLDSLAQIKQIAPEYIFHFAAYNHVGDSFLHVQEAIQSNAAGSINLFESYDGYERFVYIDTSEVYGFQKEVPFVETMVPFPTSPYAIGKYTGELYARMKHHVNNLPINIIRPFNVFGPYQSPKAVIAETIIKCLRGVEIKATEGIQTREFNYVHNLVDGVLMSANNKECIGTVLNLGSGEEIAIKDLITLIHRLTGSKSKLSIGSLPYRPTEIWRMYSNSDKARKLLGWSPRLTFEEGIVESIDWYKKYIEVYHTKGQNLGSL